jgi:hypothetical protein
MRYDMDHSLTHSSANGAAFKTPLRSAVDQAAELDPFLGASAKFI